MSRAKPSKFSTKLERLAEIMLDEAMSANAMDTGQRIEVFKVCSTYMLGMKKISAKMPEDEDDDAGGGSFKDWRGKIRSVG